MSNTKEQRKEAIQRTTQGTTQRINARNNAKQLLLRIANPKRVFI
jgi:hypothetical protein